MRITKSIYSMFLGFLIFFSYSTEARLIQNSWIQKILPQNTKQQLLIPQKTPWEVINIHVPAVPRLSCKQSLHQSGTLESRLEFCPELVGLMIWEDGRGNRTNYSGWPRERKNRLNELFQKLLNEDPSLGLNCVDPEANREIGGVAIYIPEAAALDIYLAHVAHVFYLEATDKVPWSFLDRPQIELAEFFDSNRYQSIILESARYAYRDYGGPLLPLTIQPGRDFQKASSRGFYAKNVLLCDPRIGYKFLSGELSTQSTSLIGSTEEETMAKITWWFQQNVVHGSGVGDGPDFTQWATLENRLKARAVPTGNATIVVPQGCHHAASLFYDLAKSINIPLLNVGYGEIPPPPTNSFGPYNHRGLIFHFGTSDMRILSHLDFIYFEATAGEIFPVDEVGNALSETQKIKKFFETHWVAPNTLERWSFQYLADLPRVLFNDLYDRRERLDIVARWNEEADFGQFLGWWPERSTYPAYDMYSLEKSFQLCDKRIVNFACRRARDFPIYTASDSLGSTPPVLRTEEEYRSRANTCATAYGGCSRVIELQDSWTRGMGQRVFPSTSR